MCASWKPWLEVFPFPSDTVLREQSSSASQQPWEDRAHEGGLAVPALPPRTSAGALGLPEASVVWSAGCLPPQGSPPQPWQWCREPGALFPGPPAPRDPRVRRGRP